MRRFGLAALVVVLALTPVPADASAQVRPIGRIPADGSDVGPAGRWERAAPAPIAPAYGGGAVLLDDGRFLVLGGRTGFRCPDSASCGAAFEGILPVPPSDFSRSAAMFDPRTGLWTPTAPLPVPFLPSSLVVSGGIAYASGVASPSGAAADWSPRVLAYDPVGNAWSVLPSAGGRLVDAGGTLVSVPSWRPEAGTRLHRYDPAAGRWRPLPVDPLVPREERGTAAVWADGRLLLVDSAYHDKDLGPVRLAALDFETGRWTRVRPSRPIVASVYEPPVVAAGLVVWPRGVLDLASGDAWDVPAELVPARGGRAAPPIAVGDRVVLAGRLYDPVARTLEPLPDLPERAARDREPAVAGGPGVLLRVGGARYTPYAVVAGNDLPTAETYLLRLPAVPSEGSAPIGAASSDVRPGSWHGTLPAPLAPRTHPTVLTVDDEVLAFGGILSGPSPPDADSRPPAIYWARDAALFDPASGLWRPVAPLPVPLWVESAVASAGRAYAYGREIVATGPYGDAHQGGLIFLELNPVTGLWKSLPPPPLGGRFCGLRLIDAGGRLVALRTSRTGGSAGVTYDAVTQTWKPLPVDPLARGASRKAEAELAAAWVGDRLYLVSGQRRGPKSIVAFDPTTGRWKRLASLANLHPDGAPVAVAGRLVFPGSGVFDPATRRFRALPADVRRPPVMEHSIDEDDPIPDAVVVGARIVLHGRLFDPVTRTSVPLPRPPATDVLEPGFAAASGHLVRFGGGRRDGGAGYPTPTNEAYVLRLSVVR